MNGSGLVRVLGRVGVVCVALIVLSLIGVQYAHVIGRNLALAPNISAAKAKSSPRSFNVACRFASSQESFIKHLSNDICSYK